MCNFHHSISLVYLICLMCSSFGPTIADDNNSGITLINSTNSKEGFITSPHFPSTSESNEENRVYKFLGRTNERVQIIFNDFDLHKLPPNEKCGPKNSFLSYSGQSKNTMVFICGPRPLPILSEQKKFVLKYTVPQNFNLSEEEFRGFNASYKFIRNFGVNSGKQPRLGWCEFEYYSKDTQSGSFNSPNFPGFYPRDAGCKFTFHFKEKFLKLNFTKFNLHGGSNVNCSSNTIDKLELSRLTENYEWFVYEKRCGKQDPFSITVNISPLTIHLDLSSKDINYLIFNESKSFSGFQANYEFTNQTSLFSGSVGGNVSLETLNFGVNSSTLVQTNKCLFEYNSLNATSGSFHSPNFHSVYPKNTICRFVFYGREKFLKLNFTKFNLQGQSNNISCSSDTGDVLEITGIRNSLYFKEEHCGEQDPFSITVNASSLNIILYRLWNIFNNSIFNESKAFVGFQANYKFLNENETLSNFSNLSSDPLADVYLHLGSNGGNVSLETPNFGINSSMQIQTNKCYFEYNSSIATSGSFCSPNFPDVYPKNTMCQFVFYGEEKFLKLNFKKFNLLGGSNTNCSSDTGDVLELTANRNSLYFKEERCGKHDPFFITIYASNFTILLDSSWNNTNNSISKESELFVGFQADYEFTNQIFSSSGFNLYLMLIVMCLVTSSYLGLRFILGERRVIISYECFDIFIYLSIYLFFLLGCFIFVLRYY